MAGGFSGISGKYPAIEGVTRPGHKIGTDG